MTHSGSKSKKETSAVESDDTSANEPDSKPFFNRELSWLEFNRRVLDEATDDSLPVLERLKFLSIFSTNLDEFFMIRLSGLKEQIAEGVGDLSADGMTASQQVQEIYKRLNPMRKRQVSYLHTNIFPALKEAGISRRSILGARSVERLLRSTTVCNLRGLLSGIQKHARLSRVKRSH